uniref:Dynein cytoplasmic 1 intermediate chain 1 n=1 Tax=Molossus molossus TaxID=27622 RepID=A0A7J8HBG7_MOLMO|nr:dynein cytoplasmic 1 intermediate chain 1 [Molossus molossus]
MGSRVHLPGMPLTTVSETANPLSFPAPSPLRATPLHPGIYLCHWTVLVTLKLRFTFSRTFISGSFMTLCECAKFLIRLARQPEAAAAPQSLHGLSALQHNKPLYSFEDNADYVYDVMWSPVHPALFACVDGMGRLDLWNLNNDTEVPTASVAIEGASALNRVRWAQAGKEVAVGDSEGRIWIYDVGELAVPHNDEWTRFARTLVEIRANRADSEEEVTVELSA